MVSGIEKIRREKIKKNNARFWLGKKRSVEDRAKMSLAKIGKYKGKENPFFGKTHTKTTRLKLSAALKGRKAPHPYLKGHIPWNKGIRSHHSGSKHYNWQRGKTAENFKLRNSFEMREWRKAVFMRDNWTCVFCGIRGSTLHADHIKPFAHFPDLRFSVENGRTLCKSCHRTTDTYGGRAKVCPGTEITQDYGVHKPVLD